jgi:hypothetical protein
MKRILVLVVGGLLLSAPGVYAGRGDCFNGGDPGTDCTPSNCPGPNPTTCSEDDSGCVSDTKAHAKCAVAIGKAFGGLAASVIKCHHKQVKRRFKGMDADTADAAEDTCATGPDGGKSAKERLEAVLAKLSHSGICSPTHLANAAAEEAVLIAVPAPIPSLSLDGQNGGIYCDSSMGAEFIDDLECQGGSNNAHDCASDDDCPDGGKCVHEDTGWVPKDKGTLKCQTALAQEVSKLVAATLKCHAKMDLSFFAGKAYDEEACEEKNSKGNGAHEKFNRVRDKYITAGICPPCNDLAGWDAQAATAIGALDAANVIAYPCNLGP